MIIKESNVDRKLVITRDGDPNTLITMVLGAGVPMSIHNSPFNDNCEVDFDADLRPSSRYDTLYLMLYLSSNMVLDILPMEDVKVKVEPNTKLKVLLLAWKKCFAMPIHLKEVLRQASSYRQEPGHPPCYNVPTDQRTLRKALLEFVQGSDGETLKFTEVETALNKVLGTIIDGQGLYVDNQGRYMVVTGIGAKVSK